MVQVLMLVTMMLIALFLCLISLALDDFYKAYRKVHEDKVGSLPTFIDRVIADRAARKAAEKR